MDDCENVLYQKYYSKHFSANKNEKSEKVFFNNLIESEFPSNKTSRIVDLGCGDGLFLRLLEEKGYSNYSGIDRSGEQIEIARKLGCSNVYQGDALKFLQDMKSSVVEIITTFDVIEHLEKPELALFVKEIFRVLVPGGKWIIHTVNAGSPFFGLFLYGDYTHTHAFTKRSLSQLAYAHGFSSIACYEHKPAIYDGKTFLRRILWKSIQIIFKGIIAVVGGERNGILSPNFLSIAKK